MTTFIVYIDAGLRDIFFFFAKELPYFVVEKFLIYV